MYNYYIAGAKFQDNQLRVTGEEGGDGDGTFYLPGGSTVPRRLRRACLAYLEGIHAELDRERLSHPMEAVWPSPIPSLSTVQ